VVDFQFDSTTDGLPIKIISIIDEHTRECLGGLRHRHNSGGRFRRDHLLGRHRQFHCVGLTRIIGRAVNTRFSGLCGCQPV
jgi:hypothetical protein